MYGIPVFLKSNPFSKNFRKYGHQMKIICTIVKSEVRRPFFKESLAGSNGSQVFSMALDVRNHPVGRPSRMLKKGTPMPSPVQMTSRKMYKMTAFVGLIFSIF